MHALSIIRQAAHARMHMCILLGRGHQVRISYVHKSSEHEPVSEFVVSCFRVQK